MSDYKTLADVLLRVDGVLVIDLLQHVVTLEEHPYMQSFEEPPAGIYLIGSLDPIICDRKPGFYSETGQLVVDYKHALEGNDHITSQDGTVVLSKKILRSRARFFKTEPTIPATAVKAAVSVIKRYLSILCRHGCNMLASYRLENLVKLDYRELIEKDEYMIAFEKLIDQVAEFVGDDVWCIYYSRLRGCQLVIEKGIDFRIYEYYRMKFEKEEADAAQREMETNT